MDGSSRRLSLEDCHEIDRVAYAIAKVIAKKAVAADPVLRRLDALGKASAEHTMAENMVGELQDEAHAAWIEVNRIADEVRCAD